MSDEMLRSVVAVATAVVGLAVLAVIVSRNSNTTNVIQAAASGFNNSIATAISPVTGSNSTPILAYPGGWSSFATIGGG